MARFVWATFALLVVGLVSAQGPSGRVGGRVFDPSGRPLSGEPVGLEETSTGLRIEARSDENGRYAFPLVPPGTYEIAADGDRWVSARQTLQVEVGRTLEVDLQAVPRRELDQTVRIEVSDATPMVDPDASIGFSVNRERLARLPLNRREFLPLALLAGGALPAAPGSELERQGAGGLAVNGARETSNNFLLDGIDNNDLYNNRVVVSPPLDSVREFRLHAVNYSAEFGRSAGAQVNVVSRSGANRLHASAYEYLRNDAIDARNYFDPAAKPQFNRNQFGVSVGGPIAPNRAFFFGGYEDTRVRDADTRTARVPTAAELAGDFSASLQPVIDPFTQQPFSGNRIPAERLSPIAQSLAQAWPAPNRADPAQNLVSTPVGDALANQVYGRVDLVPSDADRLYARYNFSHDDTFSPFNEGGSAVPGFGSTVLNRANHFALAHNRAFGPGVVWESRFGVNRLRREVLHQNVGNDVAGALGIPGLDALPSVTEFAAFSGFPAIDIPGYDSIGDDSALPIVRFNTTYHVLTSLTARGGAHTVKTGVEYRHIRINGIQGLFGRGQFNFLGALTTHPLSDFLLGLPTYTIQTTVDNPFRQRTSSWNAYVQDDWRLAPRLTLNLGLRYEWNRPAVDARDRFQVFDFADQTLAPAGTTDLGRAGYRGDANNFAPRIGLSWNPGRYVVRAAYGVFYDVNTLEANSGLYFNPPYFDLRLFFPSETQLLTFENPFPTGAGFTPLASVNAIQPDFRTGYGQHWNFGVERELPGRLVARAAYAASKGTKLLRRRDLNQPVSGPGEVDARRPIAGFANVVQFESGSSSSYHSGVVSLERRFASGPTFSTAYTWSKSIDNVSSFLASTGDQAFPQNSHDFDAERALSNFDARHRLVVTASLESPFQNPLARNWELHAIASWMSGRPLTPALSVDNSNTGNSGSIFGEDRPNLVGDPHAGPSTPERFFNPGAFATPPEFEFGNVGRNTLTGPSIGTVDVAVVRGFEIGERARFDVRAEGFNLTNRPNFDLPRRFADQPTFGRITSAGAARQLQLGLRITY